MAEIADSTTTVNGEGLDFGGICEPAIARKNILKLDNPEVFKDVKKIAYSDPLCGEQFQKQNLNVLRKTQKPNEKLSQNIGQINLKSSKSWPFIQLYDFKSGDEIVVQYLKNDELQENVFTVVRHLQAGKVFIEKESENFRLAELYFLAGKKSKSTAAYLASLAFSKSGC